MAAPEEAVPTIDPGTDPLDVLTDGPAATLLVVLMNIVGGVVVVLGTSSLDFKQYLTLGLGSAAVLSIGRGLAAKGDAENRARPLAAFNSIPWGTVLVYLYAVVGAIVLLVGQSGLNFQDYLTLIAGAAGTLGVGRGIASYKIDRDPVLSGTSDPGFKLMQDQADAPVPDNVLASIGADRPEDEVDAPVGSPTPQGGEQQVTAADVEAADERPLPDEVAEVHEDDD